MTNVGLAIESAPVRLDERTYRCWSALSVVGRPARRRVAGFYHARTRPHRAINYLVEPPSGVAGQPGMTHNLRNWSRLVASRRAGLSRGGIR
jgi:hypothetical protein